MCGIAGIVAADPKANIDAETIHLMCNPIVHRGPDDEGMFVDQGVGLGMRRLSIIDLAGGHQPIHNENRSVWVVCNGEIYNFLELRKDLESRGHKFNTHSDVEVIVHLYEELGSDCVQKLRGMFAIALWDDNRKKLLLARDRLGKKPLHYALHRGRIFFGSEMKSILVVAPELAAVNGQGLLEYLHLGYVPNPATAFTKIQKLPPGFTLEFHNGETKRQQYWDVPTYDTYAPATDEECLEELERLLLESTRIRMIADVPIGAFLSGGVDSSTIVAMMARLSPNPIKTFSIGFDKIDFNETQYARLVAKEFGTEHHELILEPDVLQTVEDLTSSLEEPFSDSSMLPTYYVSQLARKHVKVVLSGDGGDEAFAGYDRYRINAERRVFERIPSWARQIYREKVFPRLPTSMRGRKFSYNVSLTWQDRYIDGLSFLPAFERDTALLSDGFREAVRHYKDPGDVLRRYFDKSNATHPTSKILYADTKTYLVDDILTKVDRMSMLNSLEVRSPLLDHELIEWAVRLSLQWKLRGKKQKYILVKLAERLGIPHRALYRKKQGFALPLDHWLRNELRELLMLLVEPRSLQRGYFEPRGVQRLIDGHIKEGRPLSDQLWRLLILELWHRNFLEKYVPNAGLSSLPANISRQGVLAGNSLAHRTGE
jgi:asparagine synthase (glutamine-hydrolysing)